MKYVYIETYGCSANQSHTETMEGILFANGYEKVDSPKKADIILINTCIVKSPTENKIRDKIKLIVSKYSDKKLIIAGCGTDIGIFEKLAPNADFLSSHDSESVVNFIENSENKFTKSRVNPLVGITEISSGCLGNCTYCAVKLARGKLKSRVIKSISKEVEESVKDGCKEIWITSQDCGCYGIDIDSNLTVLLESIVKIEGCFRVRVGMMNPTHSKPILEKLIDILNDEKIYKFLHIPVQTGSDSVLRKMKRGYTVKDFENMVTVLRNGVSDLSIATDIIIGFPEETGSDFEKTCELMERIKPDAVNFSKFGLRPKTEAAKLKQLTSNVIKERSKAFGPIVKRIVREQNKKWISKECTILVNEKGKTKNQYVGRNESYKPVVVESEKNIMGKFVKVKITDSDFTHLSAEIVKSSV
ncbi:MAG: tRNA (N(6)-L-threonylcarbamoyladenosine(37)-C(2))-methylthiotransferase [Candidatus Aenigmarchaeota archaeon]|nr:tRNA (N(6)-L-threonylcarbamoyladenosine(37)-C(2))-methylthiotransferase [Candidatus Aenigmarchaeota archaeon]